MSDNKQVSGGIGFTGLLFIVFLVLKLCGVIDWSWWWISAPLWMPLALGIAIVILMIIGVIVFGCFKPYKKETND